MLPACHGPIWVIDDLTPCFKRNFLRVIFPLTACGLSLVLIVLRLVRCYIQSRKDKGYKPLSNGNVPETAEDEEEEETDLMLYKATSRVADQPLEIDRPRGEIALITLETIALLGEVGLCLAVLYTGAEGRHGTIPVVGQTVSWAYILFLVSIRLLFSITGYQSSLNLWNHTACLYGLQWIFAVFLFRSAIIHPLSRRALIFTSIEFALSCVLLLIGVTSRKGNKAVLVPQQDGLEPSREPMASLLSVASFSWLDSLVWEGYKKPLEISNVWNLKVNEQAASVLIDWRQAKRTNRLAWRLVRYFDRTLLLQGLWTIFSNLFTFLPTWLLRNILQYVEDPRSTPMNAAWFYVVLLFVSAAIQAVADGQGLWIGRKLSVKLRAIIIGEIYAKALRRRAGATVKSTKKENEDENQVGNVPKKPDPSPKNPIEEEGDSQANIGTIINLMAIDSFKVSEVSAYLHFLWAAVPVQIIMAIALLYKILGFSSLAGIVLMVLILPLNLIIAKQFSKAQNNILKGTDARIHSTNEVLQNIRIIKYFAWEQRFEDIVNEKRKSEVKYLRKRYILWTLAATLWYGTPILITFTSFFIYTVVEKKDLVPSVAFPALSMFALLRVPLDQLADMVAHVQESKVSIDRVEKYLDEDETEKYSQLSHTKDTSQPPKIGLENATLSWGSSDKKDEDDETTENSESFRLIDVNLDFKLGKLNVIAGPTGSGKTSLLMALLGEMSLVEGKVHLPGGMSDRTDLPIDPETSLTESIAYCAQEAWLVNATIKENITFASPFNKRRYETVLQVCALERDLQILDAGDQTLVGEKGISLSGGQKQRISLARAMYSNARHLLLDDCLSAVDSHTAKHIFHEAIMGPLMLNRTCILVTHNVSLTVPHSDFVVVLDNGKISAQGSPNEIALTGALGEDILKSRPPSGGTSGMPSRVPSNLEEQVRRRGNTQSSHANGTTNGDANGTASKPKQDEEGARGLYESKATGSVKMATIKMYLRSMGSWYYWVLAVIVFAAQQLGSLATNIWIRQWANSYQVKQKDVSSVASISHFKLPSVSTNNLPWALFSGTTHNHTVADFSVSEGKEVKVSYYLGMYAAIGIAYLLISMFREAVLFWGSLHASWGIHRRLLHAVMHAKFKFFDSTPLGQLMNRFSKDVEAIDQEVAPVAIGMLHCLASVILIVILISVITPGFLIAGVFITLIYAALGTLYIHSSRDLKRLESVERSPLYQQFGETLSGIVTIRAYGDSARFILDNHQRINTYNRPYIYLWASNRWLAFRVDMIGALVSFFAGAFVIMNAGTIDAGAAGLSLTYAVTFSENMLWLVRLYSSNEQNMNSVERMKEYLDVDQEADAIVHDSRPEPNWPSEGKLNFIDYSTRYRPDLDPVLKKVNFSVQPGEKVGIVGRTGAGKSSLALALFRGLEAEEGKIIIDGVDISQIGLQDLRKSITIVPQDPTLFTGTIRSNLDPFNVFTDEEIFTALRRVHLIGATGSQYSGSTTPLTSNASTLDSSTAVPSIAENKNIFLNLKSPVTEHGSNLSQGQRQLLCLARALLKNPRVLMMDEATASIDYNTDSKIQDTLRELKESTIITIAHRLQTIIDYDKVLVLDHGEVVEFDGPWQLINKEGGSFRGMCENSGTLDTLLEGAKKAWEQKRLVDDE